MTGTWTRRFVIAIWLAIGVTTTNAQPSRLPPNPTRPSPPEGIDARALAVGVKSPDVSLVSSSGTTWALAEKLRDGPAVLVFYRGDW